MTASVRPSGARLLAWTAAAALAWIAVTLSLLAVAADQPYGACVVDGARVVSYAEMAERVARTMRWLEEQRELSAGVAVVAALRIETLVVFYALFELGIPVVLIHPRSREGERAVLTASVRAALIIDESWSDEALPAPAEQPSPSPIDPERALAILFTSGTSGTPKGVYLSRRAFLASAKANAENLGWREDDRWLLCMPLAHVGGLSVVIRCLIARRPVVLSAWTGADLDGFLDAIAARGVTLLSLVPTMLSKILEERPHYRFPPCVRAVLLGGDAAPRGLLRRGMARGVPIVTTYGLTEACSQVATHLASEPARETMGVGRPLPGVEIRFCDGEIQVRGPTLMTCYYPPGAFDEPFVDDGWFPTGDLGALDDEGRLHVFGRRTDRIITGGENVDPLEIENVLAALPEVTAACVFGVADERWGQIVAAALVAPRTGEDVVERVAEHVASHLADFKRPRLLAFTDGFVVNGVGKLDRRATGHAVRSSLVVVKPARSHGRNSRQDQ